MFVYNVSYYIRFDSTGHNYVILHTIYIYTHYVPKQNRLKEFLLTIEIHKTIFLVRWLDGVLFGCHGYMAWINVVAHHLMRCTPYALLKFDDIYHIHNFIRLITPL